MAKKEEIKIKESKTDIAYRLLSKRKKEINFYDLWEKVKEELLKVDPELTNLDDDISFFYTNLTLDGRFVTVGENKWTLRDKVRFEKVHIDMNEIYGDEEEEESEEEEEVEERDDYSEDYDSTESSDFDEITQYRREEEED